MTPSELAREISALPSLDPAARALAAKRLIDEAKAVLAGVRRAAIAELLGSGQTYQQAAEALSVSAAAINAAVTEHRARDPVITRAAIAAAVRAWADPGGGSQLAEEDIARMTSVILAGWQETIERGGPRPALREYIAASLQQA